MTLNSQSSVLVTGATGNVGRNVVSQLLGLGVPVRALSRNPGTAKLPPQVEVAQGDLSAPAALETSLRDIQKMFLLCRGYSPAEIPALIQTLARSVHQIVLLSSSAIQDDLPVQTNPIGRIHLDLEEAIKQSGVEWTFLRPGAFAANALSWWAPQLRGGNILRWPYARSAWAPIHERDIAAVAVTALTQSGHSGNTYFLTGGQVLTQEEQLKEIGNAIGRTLIYQELSRDEAKKQMSASMPPFVVDRLLEIWAQMVHSPAPVSHVVNEITGRPPSSFREWALEHAADFQSGKEEGKR